MINLIPYILAMYMYQCIVCPETELVPITICIAIIIYVHALDCQCRNYQASSFQECFMLR